MKFKKGHNSLVDNKDRDFLISIFNCKSIRVSQETKRKDNEDITTKYVNAIISGRTKRLCKLEDIKSFIRDLKLNKIL